MPDSGDAGAPEALPEAQPDGLRDALRGARPGHEDMSATLSRARIAVQLFGATEVVRIGRYEVEAKAGAGGGGEVFVARDPELSRRVAIKLMRAGGYRDRMLVEGQALARLSHPNIVPVYDAGTMDDQVYVVMELVEGDTLRAYCEAAARTVREIVRAYRQAAEGLAAAHRAGFIHRDFKPDNALVGRDGRVRVVDFGLARSGGGEGAGDDGGRASPVNVTRAGLGTPRYMAPEQAAGATLTPAADQYAFCASLHEGLLARAPAVPRWLEAIIRRGTAPEPAERYPSMAAVHAALGRDPASRWRTRGLVAGVLGIAAAAFVIGRTDRAATPSCDRGAAELAGAWSATASSQIAAHFTTLATPYVRQAEAHVLTVLEGYATRWRAGHRDACTAHRDGTQSTTLFDRRVACLARARAALGTAVSVVSSVTADRLAEAIGAIGELPDLERCADASALTTAVAPPRPAVAAAVAAVSDELASLEVEVRAARPDVRPRIEVAVARARALDYPPLVARALRLAGVAALAVDARRDAVAPLAEATTLALTAGDQALAVEAFARRLYAAATTTKHGAFAEVDLVEAIAAGLPPSERAIRALFDNSLGSVALAAGKRDQARAAFERALRSAREVTGPAALEVAGVWTNVALVIDDPARRIALAQERIAIVEAGLGAGHPLVLAARISAAHLETDRRSARAALEPPCNTLVELQPEHGFEILQCQFHLGWLAFEQGDVARARAAFTRAVGSEATGGNGVKLTLARAHLDLLAGRLAEAANELDAARAELGPLDHAAWWVLADAADMMLARGAIARRAGHEARAGADFEAARQTLETVLTVSSTPRNARRLAFARASLVRSWVAGPLPPDARRHAEAAIAWYRAAGGYDDVIDELERVLARRS